MLTLTGTPLKQALSIVLCVALTLGAAIPASARHNGRGGPDKQSARQAHARSAQRPTYVRSAPRTSYTSSAPRASYVRSAPRARYVQPRERFVRSAPQHQHVVRSAPRHQHVLRSAPRETFVRSAPQHQHVVRGAPQHQHVMRNAPRETFVQTAPRQHATKAAPFVQYVRAPSARKRVVTTREIVRSPLMRSMVAPRMRTAIAYHPAYLAGRVVSVTRDRIVLDPPVGVPIVVRDVSIANPTAIVPMGTYVTLPVTYSNGYYTLYPQATYNGYAYAPPAYCYGPSSTLYAALIPAVIGALSGNASSFNSSDLAAVALTAASGSNSCSPYETAYAAPIAYPAPAAYVTPVAYSYNTYATPYDSCVWSDNDEDGYDAGCISPQQTAYAYSPYAAYAPQQVQGLVVARSGNMLMVLGANGMQPIFVNAAPALHNGFALNGPVAVGQVIDAIGYYNGETFVATALE